MIPIVTVIAEADEIIVVECQLRIFVIVLDMMYCLSLPESAVSLATLALIVVAPQDCRTFLFRRFAFIKFVYHKYF